MRWAMHILYLGKRPATPAIVPGDPGAGGGGYCKRVIAAWEPMRAVEDNATSRYLMKIHNGMR